MRGDTVPGAWIVLGGVHHLNQTAPRRDDDAVVLVRVLPQEVCVPSTTVIVRWDTLGICPVSALTSTGRPLGTDLVDGSALYPDAIAGSALRALVGEAAAPGLVPLCYLSEHPGGGYHAYAQIRFHHEDACFVRTTREPVGAGPVESLRWLKPTLDEHANLEPRLNNHQRYYRTHFAGTELEYKYNLEQHPNIWASSMELLKALRHGELPDCLPEYRQEFEINAFDNHMYEVLGPEQERGYASFIPMVDGRHLLKRKWFTEDAFARREELFSDIEVAPHEFAQFLRSEHNLRVQALPAFRRVRYDIQCESMRTGHVYGIFFDRCSLLAAPEILLSQCEIEYRRSRSVLDQDKEELLTEMDRIDHWLSRYLAGRSLAKQRTLHSKLSFLREVVAARPDLVPDEE
ncbi:hypothetical protein [Streptacidiphilus sp. P02-A3a]|uniref:hypothetical protein n=1 Tax=Streptacidiphilus sp. P02-A3a TaxID=2704468 RepID=UPI0015FCBD84|nr:hypothetical protein [Streptacidiphilus sp. P02-A3a]QMU67281.1 hypothetical protein GXP74_02720 [Streptacidiphilus sp. P02-A3a]